MLSRLYKSYFRVLNGRFLSTYDRIPQATLENDLKILKNESNYTIKDIPNVIRTYFFIYSKNKSKITLKNWPHHHIIIESVKKLTPLISSMPSDSILVLIKNLDYLRIKDNDAWSAIEEVFIQRAHDLTYHEILPSIILCFARTDRKNNKLWVLLEEKIMSEISNGQQFNSNEISNICKAFLNAGYGSEAFYNKIKENVEAKIDHITSLDLIKIIQSYLSSKNITPEFLEVLFKKLADKFLEMDDEMKLSCLKYAILLRGNEKHIIFFEEIIGKNINMLNDNDFIDLSVSYGGLEDSKKTEDRKKFMVLLEKHYNKIYQMNLKILKKKNIYREIKIFWGFSKFDLCSNQKAWKNLLNDIAVSEDQSMDALKDYVKELQEFARSKNLVS
ncbi:hypothetical protein SteCoe_8668 [Stentor coeruleus]|uniref:Uncharacterized protein n=1 Tax=Stentor coeruleus TaxID=5963 RepID=A0A1R2CJH6_9CILI|nr:hypothetical protein SteCoe_8668 [Stentor coeruleus]